MQINKNKLEKMPRLLRLQKRMKELKQRLRHLSSQLQRIKHCRKRLPQSSLLQKNLLLVKQPRTMQLKCRLPERPLKAWRSSAKRLLGYQVQLKPQQMHMQQERQRQELKPNGSHGWRRPPGKLQKGAHLSSRLQEMKPTIDLLQ